MSVIYRKYRPQQFKDVVGQEHITTVVTNELAGEMLPHAYLFVGPRGTGKTTMARLVARSLNCLKRKKGAFEPCNTCLNCTAILSERYLDVIEIDAATHTQVDNVRDVIIASVKVPPTIPNGYKVFIIDEVHMLSRHAFNALLKTIEEPPEHVIFILATTNSNKVPDTIISRCQRFDFKKITVAAISQRLQSIAESEKLDLPASLISAIAREAHGSLRDAESLFGQFVGLSRDGVLDQDAAELILPQQQWNTAATMLRHIAAKDPAKAITTVHTNIENGADPELIMQTVIEFLRHLLLHHSIGESYAPDLDEGTGEQLLSIAKTLPLTETRRLLTIALDESDRARHLTIPELPLEILIATFCDDSGLPTRPAAKSDKKMADSKNSKTTEKKSDSDSLKKLQQAWPKLLNELKNHNHSLAIFMKVAHPLAFSKDTITIGFKYDFHADSVRETKTKLAAEKAFSKVLGSSVMIDCVVDPSYSDNHKNFNGAQESEVKDILDVMGGGEVV